MNKTQIEKLASYKLIVTESKTDPEALSQVPKFLKGINRLEQINAEIESNGIQQEKNLRGITTDKDHTLVALVDRTIEVAGAVHSHASETGNNALMSRVDYKPSVLKKMSQTEILTVAGVVLEEAHRLSPEILQDEGVSAEDLADYEALINEFGDVQSSPKEAVIDRSGATERLIALFAEARGIIKNSLDKLAPQYKRKNPEFYRRYKAARRVTYRSAPKPETEGEQAAAMR